MSEHDQEHESGNSQPLSQRSRWIAASIVAVLVGALIVVLATSTQGGDNRVASPLIGEQVPAVESELLLSDTGGTTASGTNASGATTDVSTTFNIDALTNRWVLVNFFASWCVPCRQEHPELVAWSDSHRFDGQVVSIPFGDTDEDAIGFFAEYGGDWPVLRDSNARWAVAFGVLRPPESFLVAPNGTVVARWQGRITAAEIDQVIAEVTSA